VAKKTINKKEIKNQKTTWLIFSLFLAARTKNEEREREKESTGINTLQEEDRMEDRKGSPEKVCIMSFSNDESRGGSSPEGKLDAEDVP
jgi:hypothetical protein